MSSEDSVHPLNAREAPQWSKSAAAESSSPALSDLDASSDADTVVAPLPPPARAARGLSVTFTEATDSELVATTEFRSAAGGPDTYEAQHMLLQPDEQRYVMFPIRDTEIWDMYKRQIDSFWRADEIDLSDDLQHWREQLTDNDRRFISSVLAFFAASDGIVNENLAMRFMNDVQLAEARAFYGFQIAMENIHSETYSMLIDHYIKNTEDKMQLFQAIKHYPCIRKKAVWAQRWISDHRSSFATRLVAFACVEGIFFSGAFCSIFWLKKRGLMPGLTFSNELISRDEALHCEFAILLFQKLGRRIDQKRIHDIIRNAVEIEQEFICDALPCSLIGMNAELMTQYIQFVADRLATQLGYSKIYNVSNPFDFMDMISIGTKTNFFEKRNSEYSLYAPTASEKEDAFAEMADDDCF